MKEKKRVLRQGNRDGVCVGGKVCKKRKKKVNIARLILPSWERPVCKTEPCLVSEISEGFPSRVLGEVIHPG